jgi:hypothetical protein
MQAADGESAAFALACASFVPQNADRRSLAVPLPFDCMTPRRDRYADRKQRSERAVGRRQEAAIVSCAR